MKLSVYTDGGSRGNPGISGFGVAILDDTGQVIAKLSKFIGIKTNNEAEYSALIEALTWLNDSKAKFSIDYVNFYSDSQLMVRQVQGKYQVKADNIKPLIAAVRSLLTQLDISYQFNEILRDKNKLADELANHAMDLKR